ncbi:alkylation response protein AidB-like acyl-CoA dehydrogenase [Mycolicibacterium sp. BK556]|uniref:acyl-CoA dehydrogenase family protein n=1 Tax=Mycobacteriaceae TaxID=1762 RepID=UPI00105B8867|nr:MULTISPECIES: acyl-CoA dehydrogenase family protein [Mycobacteriaceae]MBB3605863.1 alkylation response protein AidB-like acyl-CoA dehydrogenase [Mycolicibacterium sp. BK556]MBB3635640.1 alkylation response protein AidB-like acyl-CoA dehydrogenase [Mycolicibacterium sp. BK607]MBB3753057.1 alkylation response protein AidB-like acyl-CoA dehydrogenase [Mycolicibacterium sp. BK634]TDO09178.1 alkylation response protein AidB-like acyl-CoA dehydrogenase [Mycobacterium sp. BK086]
MTTVEPVNRILPGTPEFTALLANIRAGAKDRDLNDENPFDQVDALKRAGFGTLRLPAELDGPGFTVRQLFSTIVDVAAADPIVAHIFRTHFWFVEERLRTLSDPRSRQWLTKVADGNIVGNAFSEKGSNAVGSLVFNTRLLPVPGGFRLTGEKYYSTGTLFADYLTVTATTDHDSVATVIVPADRDGVRLVDDWDGFGQRRTGTGTTTFTSVDVAPDEVLTDASYDADPVPTVQYASLQLYIHAVVAGVLQTIVDDGVELLRSRTRSFSHALTDNPVDDPLYQRQLGELASTAYIARAAVLDAAAAIEAATDSVRDGVPDADLSSEAQLKVAKVKVHLDDVAPEAATRLLELGGASAASRQRNLDRHWRNIRTITLHNPVAYKARVVGQNLLHGSPIPANAYF